MKIFFAFVCTVFLSSAANAAPPPPEAARINGLYYWEGTLFDGTTLRLVGLLKVDVKKDAVNGNIFLEETPFLLSNNPAETSVAISIRGDTLWFAQKRAMLTYSVAQDSTGKALYTRWVYLPKPGESLRQALGEIYLKKTVSFSSLTPEESRCADIACMKDLSEKYFGFVF